MTNRIIFIGWFLIAVGFAISWYPLKYLKGMQMGSPQLLFYAFASASLSTLPWLAYQAKEWRNRSESLLLFGITGSVMVTFLNFSIASGDPLGVVGLFCLTLSSALLLKRVLSNQALVFKEFLVLLLIIVVSLVSYFGMSATPYKLHWTQFTAIFAGIASYWFYKSHGSSHDIPLGSKLAAVFICSTWLVGMVIIFSPRFVSFPYENAVLMSIAYGVVFLIPIVISISKVFSVQDEKYLLLWLVMGLATVLITTHYVDVTTVLIDSVNSVDR